MDKKGGWPPYFRQGEGSPEESEEDARLNWFFNHQIPSKMNTPLQLTDNQKRLIVNAYDDYQQQGREMVAKEIFEAFPEAFYPEDEISPTSKS